MGMLGKKSLVEVMNRAVARQVTVVIDDVLA